MEDTLYGSAVWAKRGHFYDLHEDPQELTDLAASHPEKMAEMLGEWEAYAKAVGYIEASGEQAYEQMTAEEFLQRLRLPRWQRASAAWGRLNQEVARFV